MTSVRKVKVLLIGAGNVGRRFLELVEAKKALLREQLGFELQLVGVSDTTGCAVCSEGLDASQIVAFKNDARGVADYPGWGRPGMTALELIQEMEADLLVEASPANLQDGEPGLGCIQAALTKGIHVVTANKAPLVLAFPHLMDLAKRHGAQLDFDATVAGGLPAVNLGRRDLAAAHIQRIEGVLNLTTNYILTRMADDGLSYDEALGHAQRAGHAETDPTLDVDGWDAASKLIILAHSVLQTPLTLQDLAIEGIRGVTQEMHQRAASQGERIKLLALAEETESGYEFSVRPTWLPAQHPLAQLRPKQMGIVYHSDISGVISASIVEETPVPTASAVLRDVVGIFRTR
jgi:homoserine dehydrogenase